MQWNINERLSNEYKHRGLLPRVISKLYKDINLLTEKDVKVKMSYVEIHNENIHDLLGKDVSKNILVQEHPVYGVICKGAVVQEVTLYIWKQAKSAKVGKLVLTKNIKVYRMILNHCLPIQFRVIP